MNICIPPVDRDTERNIKFDEIIYPKSVEATDRNKYLVIVFYSIFLLLSSLLFNTPSEIILGMGEIVISPSILVSDYLVIANLGAALFNCGLLMLVSIAIAKANNINMNGTLIAAIFTVGGFALFGKNIYNVWPIFLGIYIYARVQEEEFGKFILVALFGTALGPLISQVSFGFEFSNVTGVILGCFLGVLAGFILPPLANHFVKFHQGFNIYNIGFTAGMVGSLFMAGLRAFELETPATSYVAEGYNVSLGIYLSLIFISMIMVGYLFNNRSLKGYRRIIKHSGRLVADFVNLEGFGISFINMGLLGLISTAYIILVGGEINGPIIGGIFTIVGFGAFGKHAKNIIPVLVGVYLSTFVFTWDPTSTGALLGALFGTTLAPIAGEFGYKSGILAGFLHMAMVMNVGSLHGGVNLYNNGFSGGLVAAILVPILVAFKKNSSKII